MKVAVIGSRNLSADVGRWIPSGTTAILSGGALGIDKCARAYAVKNNIPLLEFLPDYAKYGRRAPLIRNVEIITHADLIIAVWDGHSPGTKFVIDRCRQAKKSLLVYMPKETMMAKQPIIETN